VKVKILQNKGKFEILAIMPEKPLELIEIAGRVSYESQDKIEAGSAEKFVKKLRERGHESVLEHSSMTVFFSNVSRGFTHETVRHRIASFTQKSTRYVRDSIFKVIAPPDKDVDEELVTLRINKKNRKISFKISFRQWIDLNRQMYHGLIKAGWAKQDARQVLPIGIEAPIVVTANFREWRHIFELRCSKAAHWEIRRVMLDLLIEVQKRVPVVFDDFEIHSDFAEKPS